MKAADLPEVFANRTGTLIFDHYPDGAHHPTRLPIADVQVGTFDRWGQVDGDPDAVPVVAVHFHEWYDRPAILELDDNVDVYRLEPVDSR